MRIAPTTTTVAVLTRPQGGAAIDALFTSVTRSPLGSSARRLGTVRNIAAASLQDIQAATQSAKGKLVIVLPASDCFAKPIAMSAQTFRKAKDELVQTIDELFPISADDALVGLIDRAQTSSQPADPTDQASAAEAGYLIAAQRNRVSPAIAAIESALSTSAHRTLSPHMAALGLNALRDTSRPITIEEQDPAGNRIHHTYDQGLASRLTAPATPSATADARIPASLDAEGTRDAHELAIAAAIIDDTAPGNIAPLTGPTTSRAAHWAAPGVFTVAAAALVLAASLVATTRFSSAAESQDQRAASLQDDYSQAQAQRERLAALAADVARAQELGFPRVGRTLADVWSAVTVLPPDAYYTRIELTPARALLDGVAQSSGDVLQRLEASEAFTDARRERGSGRVPGQPDRETFSLSATRLFDDRTEANQ